jgi:hypothetical protein
MELIFRATLFLAGLINIAPAFLAFAPERIKRSYGIDVPNANYELLLRHRAVLFGLVGGLMIVSAITKKYYELATGAGLVSMVSFIVLYLLIGKEINTELKRVMQIDVVATVVLLIGFLLYWLPSQNAR